MSEITQVTNASEAVIPATGQTKKVVRRGVSNASGTRRLTFTEKQAHQNHLFIGHLDKVEVIISKNENEKDATFNGYDVPRLVLTFASNDEELVKRRYVTQTFFPIGSTIDTIPGGRLSFQIDNIFNWLKHVLDVYLLKGRELTEAEEAMLELAYQDFDENGQFLTVETQVIVDAWTALFNNFKALLEPNGKPIYFTADGKVLPIWMKLLRYIKVSKGQGKDVKHEWVSVDYRNRGNLAFTQNVGQGAIELYKAGVQPVLTVNAARESIIIQASAEQVETNQSKPAGMMGGMPAGVMMGGNVVTDAPLPMGGMPAYQNPDMDGSVPF